MSGAVVSAILLSFMVAATPPHVVVVAIYNPSPAPYAGFGEIIDAANGYLAVGNPIYNGGQGAVSVYSANDGSEIYTLIGPIINQFYGGDFGSSVEIAGNRLFVGAPFDTIDGVAGAGQVYVFDVAHPGLPLAFYRSPHPERSGQFGYTIDVADGLLAVGAPSINGAEVGHAYIFDLQTSTETATLVSPNRDVPAPTGGGFGAAISVSDGRVIVGAPDENQYAGRAYVFDALTGALINSFVSPNYPNEAYFGTSVALSNRFAFVGSSRETVNGFEAAGSVFVFEITGSLVRTLVDPNPQTPGFFGFSLALNGQNLIVGAPFDNVTKFTFGRVYVFGAESGTARESLVSPDVGVDGSPGCFGRPVDSANGRIYVSAPCQQVNGQPFAGALYIFSGVIGHGQSGSDQNQP